MSSTVRPDELSVTLRRLRQDAQLSGIEAARAAGLSQPKISRLETGKQVPTAAEVEALCRVYSAPARTRQQMLTIARDLREEQVSARVMLQRGAYRMQERVGRIEAASRLLRTFHPAVVIGLLQTPGYIRGLLGESLPDDEVERMVAARGDRQRLLDTDREFVLIMTEGALRWHVGSPAVMIAQLQHLAEATRRSNVRVGVIPWTKPVRTGALHGSTSTTGGRRSSAPRPPRPSSPMPVTSPTTRPALPPTRHSRCTTPTPARSSTGSPTSTAPWTNETSTGP